MWLKQLFMETTIDFEKRCKTRIVTSIIVATLGALSILLSFMADQIPVLYLESGFRRFVPDFYRGAGCGLLSVAIVLIIRNIRYLKNPELCKKQEVVENDERNRMLGLRCWAYAGYSMFLFLYIGMLFAGFISMTVLKVLLVVGGVYGLLLLIFRLILRKVM